ncbi:MAG: VaFE repeat-containing surface-anchored protein [Clostridiales bacterium]|nr:VaFE repeat-containing surface-anchored protein [Clostridiales bacterium]
MKNKGLTGNLARLLAVMITAAVAVCSLPFFIGTKIVNAAVLSSNALVSEANTKKAGYTSAKSFRNEILAACSKMSGVKYQWGGGGWNGIDCAGSVSLAYSVALKTAKITGTSGSYGKKTLSYSGGANPDKYGFFRPGFAGIKSSFKDSLLKNRGITPAENKFSSFETNGKGGIQDDEWIKIINTYGFKPGDMILWWNDNKDKNNAQHITIYAGIEDGVPMQWTASSTTGYFCKKSLSSSSSEAGKGSFTGFMGLRATGLSDDAYAGFYLDKRDPSGINYTGAVFTVYKDQDLNSIAGELRDDDNDGIYTDFYLLSASGFTKQKYRLTPKDQAGSTYEDTLYIKETTIPDGLILPDGTRKSLKDQDGNIPAVYKFSDPDVYEILIRITEADGSSGRLEYSIKNKGGSALYSFVKDGYAYTSGSDVMLVTNMKTSESEAGRGKGAGLFTDASSVKLEKTTSTSFDTSTVVFKITEGGTTVATYRFSDGKWNWYDAFGDKWEGTDFFPLKYGTEYVITETFDKGEPFMCADGTVIEYEFTNDSGWTKTGEASYQYVFKTDSLSSAKTYSFKCENNKHSGALKLLKAVEDEDDTREGFVFELWNKEKSVKLAEGVSDKDGNVQWKTGGTVSSELSGIPVGGYFLVEVRPDHTYHGSKAGYVYEIPEGFTDGKDGKWYKEIEITTETLNENVTNDRLESSIKVIKTSEDGITSNVEFTLTYGGTNEEPSWDDSVLVKGRTDKNGAVSFSNIPTGWYRIEEKIEPAYKLVWDDGTEGKTRTVRLTEKNDNKVVTVKAVNKLDINPRISTSLTDSRGSHSICCGKDIELTDMVRFENLILGYEYKISGCLLDKATGEILKDKDGNEYRESVIFKADRTAGEVSLDEKGREVVAGEVAVKFTIDSSYLFSSVFEKGGSSLSVVCFETLYFRDITIAKHNDLEDEDQTVTVKPLISTTASDSMTGTGVLALSDNVGINDNVVFEGLNPGERYVLTGTLMDRATGEPYLDPDGNTYTKNVVFRPEGSSGYVIVPFGNVKVPTDMIELVVFESLKSYDGGYTIALHEDINDEGQTLRRPSCKTVATTVKGDKAFLKDSTVTIVDHVSYENLEAGHTYYAKAVLRLTDGTEVTNKGTEVVSLQQFEPSEPSGTVDVTIKFRSTGLESGDTVVVLENIYDMSTEEEVASGMQTEDIRVLSHEDLNNKDQSLAVTDIPMSGEILSGKTVIGLIVFVISAGAGAYVITGEIKRKRIRRNR